MKEKPILKLYKYEDSQFKQIAQIDDYQEISFEHNLYSAGTFTITINYNIPNALLFERGMFIQFGSDPYDFGEILSIRDSIGQDGKGSQIRTITGYDARYIFKRRVIKNLNSNGMWKMTAKGEACMRELISSQCGANAEEKRRLPITNEYNKFLANKFVSTRNNLTQGGYGILGGCQKEKGLPIFIAKLEGIFVSRNYGYNDFLMVDNMRAENIIWSNRIRKYVCVGASTNYGRLIKYSSNGQQWQTAYSEQVDDRILCICETPDKLVAISISGGLFTSDDAVSWTEIQSNLPSHISSICYSEDLRLFVGISDYYNFIVYSDNLTTWTSVSSNVGFLNCVIWNSDLKKFVACGQDVYVIISSDGIHWEKRLVDIGQAFWLRYDRETQYTWICGSNGIARSLNLEAWKKTTGQGEFLGINREGKVVSIYPEKTYTQIEENSVIGNTYSVSEAYTNLYEVCKTIATQSEIGWRVKFENGNLTLECFEGTDRSNTVQFSTDFDSLRNGEFSDSSESYSNAIYIGGKGQNDERDIYEGEDGTPNGLDRFEAWDDQSQMTTTDEYTAEALSMLSQYGQTVNVSGNGLAKCPYIYKEQYDVGDIITIAFSGKTAKVQILSVTERWAWNQYDINFSFGKPQNNLAEQLQLMLRKIQGASNKANATESVKWYTIPTVSVMPADDVTFNTIGFTGTMAADSTFTLYRDSEGTGAKSYNIYTKNLSGNYTLTLTTGVSGATNFTIKGGSNIVARILVDENGNIVSQSMTATDLIESGNNQPATSSGVAGAIQNVTDIASSLPTDAVLHYSFDEVPDYPDGTSVYFRNKDFTSTSGWIVPSDFTISVENNCLKISSNNTTRKYMLTRETNVMNTTTLNGKLVKIKIRSSFAPVGLNLQEQINYSTFSLSLISKSGDEYVYAGVPNFPKNAVVYVVSEKNSVITSSDYFIIEQIYIGDGSYSTPIIDNANGQNNATNNGGIAVQGISGKGAYFLNGKYANIDNYNLTPNFTVSMWVNPDNNEMASGSLISKSGQFILRNGSNAWWGNGIFIFLYGANSTLLNGEIPRGLLPPKVWTLITVVRKGLELLLYINGSKTNRYTLADGTIAQNTNSMMICNNANTRPQSIDDLLIFDRALSDTEVQALYQNKANTPKYYSWADWKLSQV